MHACGVSVLIDVVDESAWYPVESVGRWSECTFGCLVGCLSDVEWPFLSDCLIPVCGVFGSPRDTPRQDGLTLRVNPVMI